MERITGSDALGLIEAYNTVYAPQEEIELTEEQVQEDFENWVNSLVEEGHDLSEYTWEDMYEEYLNEYAAGGVPGPGGAVRMYSRPVANTGSSYQSRFARPMNAGTPQTFGGGRVPTRTVRPQVGGLPSSARQVTQYPQGVSTGVGGGNAAASRQTLAPAPARPSTQAPARPAAATPATRPAAQAPARPATAPAGVPKPAPAATAPATAPATPARTFNPLMQRTFGYQTGNAPSQIAAASAGRPVPSGTALGSAANPDVRKKLNLPAKNLKQDLDMFDLVKGHLLDEGYADTEDAALQIMANMSEEWREGILEKFGLAADPSKPQSPKPTKLARKRKRHDDWEGSDGEKTEQRARRVIGTQRRQDTETGVTN
jgi:hypothetical protein